MRGRESTYGGHRRCHGRLAEGSKHLKRVFSLSESSSKSLVLSISTNLFERVSIRRYRRRLWRLTVMRTTVPVRNLSYSSQGATREPVALRMLRCTSLQAGE